MDRLLHAVARLARGFIHANQGFVYQMSKQVQDIARRQALACTDVLRRLERPAPRKGGEPPEQDLFRLSQKAVTPIDKRAQGLMAWSRP